MKKRILSIMLTLAMVLTMTAVLSVGVSAGNAPDYTIVIFGDKAYKNFKSGDDITAAVADMGLTYAGGVWTMNNFNFTTTADVAMKIVDVTTTITVTGNNSITGGDGENAYGLDIYENTDGVTLQGTGSLTVTAGNATGQQEYSYAIRTKANLTVQGITLTGIGSNGFQSSGMYSIAALTVTNATVTLNGGTATATTSGLRLNSDGTVSVNGTGKITATAGSTGTYIEAISCDAELSATAKDGNGNPLTWDENDSDYEDEGGNVATTVVLTSLTPAEPEIVQGDGQTVDVTMVTFATFASDAAASEFVKVTVDGKDVAADYYTLGEETETTVIKLNEAFLATLGNGAHTISIVSTSGSADCAFTVAGQSGAAQTGDGTTIVLWAALIAASSLAILAISKRRKSVTK